MIRSSMADIPEDRWNKINWKEKEVVTEKEETKEEKDAENP